MLGVGGGKLMEYVKQRSAVHFVVHGQTPRATRKSLENPKAAIDENRDSQEELTRLKAYSDSCQRCGSIIGIVECSDCGGASICSECFQKVKNMGRPKDNPRPRAVAAANAMELWLQEIDAKEWLRSSYAKCPKLTRSLAPEPLGWRGCLSSS